MAKQWFLKLIMSNSNFKIKLWRHFSDAITIMSPKNVTKITSQIFFQFGPLPIKISGYASVVQVYKAESLLILKSIAVCHPSFHARFVSPFYVRQVYGSNVKVKKTDKQFYYWKRKQPQYYWSLFHFIFTKLPSLVTSFQ